MTVICGHPLAKLEVDAGNSAARGQATVFNVKCRACLVTLAGAQGLHALVVALAADTDALWGAVFAIGGRRSQPAPATAGLSQAGPAAPCAHFLSWLKLEVCEARRGAEARATFRCSGCCESWPVFAGFSVYLERLLAEREALREAVRQLGSVI